MSTHNIYFYGELTKTRAVRGSDYSPAIALSEEKDKLVTENWRDKIKKNNGTNKYEQPDFSIQYIVFILPVCIVSTFYASQFWRNFVFEK